MAAKNALALPTCLSITGQALAIARIRDIGDLVQMPPRTVAAPKGASALDALSPVPLPWRTAWFFLPWARNVAN
jgi:hypothetical protein